MALQGSVHPADMPGLIVAGVPKAGTSSVFAWLQDHPDAVGSTVKETCFFVDPESHNFEPGCNVRNGLTRYVACFPAGDRRFRFEATPSYIYNRTALEHVPALPGAPRVLFVLREPAAQIRSLFYYFRENWDYIPAGMTFDAFLDAARAGTHGFGGNELVRNALSHARYVDWLEPWRAALPADRMKVLLFEDLVRAPRDTMSDIATWCGLDPSFYASHDFSAENETYYVLNRRLQRLNIAVRERLPQGRVYGAMRRLYRSLNTRNAPGDRVGETAMQALRDEYRPANTALAERFGLDLSAWERRRSG